MGRLIVSMNLSLDGCIEAQGQDDGSWLRIDEEVHRAFNPDFRFGCGTFSHPISRHALIFAGSARGTPSERVTPCG